MSNETQTQQEVFFNELVEEFGEKTIALAQHLNLTLELDEDYEDEEEKQEAIEAIKDDLNCITENYGTFDYYREEYLVLTDEEADKAWDEELQYYIDEIILPEIPKSYQNYFDEEAWKRDAQYDGRGHALNRYDGSEYVETVNGTDYYIYRQN